MLKRINAKEYEDWSKEELIKEIVKIKSTTYGLVWHRDLPEEKIDILVNPDARTPNELFPNEMAGKPFPVLKEVKNKAIESDKSKLVNLLIEGDNYHSLAVLNFTHREAVDLIYIDPPYNTGNDDFIYNDKFVNKEDSFRHSMWLSFMEKRLKLAKNLLKPDGVIFISIDDNEQAPLKMLCDEIFGGSTNENFIGTLIWQRAKGGGNSKKVVRGHEYILCYSKGGDITLTQQGDKESEHIKKWKSGKAKDKYVLKDGKLYFINDDVIRRVFGKYEKGTERRCEYENLLKFKGTKVKEEVDQKLASGEYILRKVAGGKHYVCRLEQIAGMRQIMYTLIQGFLSEVGKNDLAKLGMEDMFDYPKPVGLIKIILDTVFNENAVILDFFAGSGTTGQAVLELNHEHGGKRTFILCTNNGDEKSKHKIASEICYPRIKKIIGGYKNSEGKKVEGLGGNLKYYTTDFVEAEPTDKNKRKLVKESTDMLCILENAFELVSETPEFKIFKNTDKYVGVIFYEEAIEDYKKAIKKIDGHFNTYVFSMGDDPHAKKFADLKGKVTLCAIPEVILKVYREIFK